jgi:hypothetical protein
VEAQVAVPPVERPLLGSLRVPQPGNGQPRPLRSEILPPRCALLDDRQVGAVDFALDPNLVDPSCQNSCQRPGRAIGYRRVVWGPPRPRRSAAAQRGRRSPYECWRAATTLRRPDQVGHTVFTWRACSGTRSAHQRRTRATSISGSGAVVEDTGRVLRVDRPWLAPGLHPGGDPAGAAGTGPTAGRGGPGVRGCRTRPGR